MRTKDLHILPKFGDRTSYLYVEHCTIDQEEKAIAIHDKEGLTPVPCASLALLMLGPGTRITHKAIVTLSDSGCLVAWCGEQGVRFYACGYGVTRSARNILKQAECCMDEEKRMKIVKAMYQARFTEELPQSLSLEQIRGMEGARVRAVYRTASEKTGVPWSGRSYQRGNWASADPVNRALSAANSCLYGVCNAAIVAMGFSPALGFVHTGKQLSFVYDIADLYKADTTIPLAFEVAAVVEGNIERNARLSCRDMFARTRLIERVAKDIAGLFSLEGPDDSGEWDSDPAEPGYLWNADQGVLEGGASYAVTEKG